MDGGAAERVLLVETTARRPGAMALGPAARGCPRSVRRRRDDVRRRRRSVIAGLPRCARPPSSRTSATSRERRRRAGDRNPGRRPISGRRAVPVGCRFFTGRRATSWSGSSPTSASPQRKRDGDVLGREHSLRVGVGMVQEADANPLGVFMLEGLTPAGGGASGEPESADADHGPGRSRL